MYRDTDVRRERERERERRRERERGLGFGFRVQGLGPWVVGFRVFFSSLRALK